MSQLSHDLGRDKPGAWSRLQELELRDWAVRVLDAWAQQDPTRLTWVNFPEDDDVAPFVSLRRGHGERSVCYSGSTPDDSRLAAAEAVFPTLPAEKRAELGERP